MTVVLILRKIRGTEMARKPSANGDNGRNAQGRFTEGNPGGPGNPFARQVAALRRMILDAVTEDDLKAVVAALVERAKAGDIAAARELLTRLVGKPAVGINPDRLDVDEELLERELHQATPSDLERLLWNCDRL